ncbi:GGDEF domain-containing protein [Nocardioides sambongensis]|uniref:GGDEF domain-containing protein n=1 Tax=Nocardioides sambongensis TaxID=2589074 RepID=UPI0015E86DC1|nr:GGDEF domain-containing protein [Nocardioides sambongensis]
MGLVLVLAAALFGIWTRASDSLASFWPANALLLGALVRWPGLRVTSVWVGAAAGLLVADLLTGSGLLLTLGLSAANLAGVVAGVLLVRRWSPSTRRLEHPRAVLELIVVCAAAALAAAVVGASVGVLLLDLSPWSAVQTWFSAEFATYLAILPVVLTVPAGDVSSAPGRGGRSGWGALFGPVLVLVPVLAAGIAVGGPGALAFSVPVLLWSALRGDVFVTSVLILLTTEWNLMALSSGLLDVGMGSAGTTAKVSLQLGVALTSMGPLMVAAATRAREDLLRSIRVLAEHDELTGVRNRRGFVSTAEVALAAAHAEGLPAALLMVDLDEFKAVNDRFGHDAGDALLRSVGVALADVTTSEDLVGRLGGEEFAVLVSGARAARADQLAHRVLDALRGIDAGPAGAVTASIGVALAGPDGPPSLSTLLVEADRRLYRAKRDGRNRVEAGG